MTGPESSLVVAALRRLADAYGLHVFCVEVDESGHCDEIYAGPGLETLLGGAPPAGADVGREWSARVHPQDRDAYRAALRRIHAGVADEVEYRLCGYDGTTRWVRESGVPHAVGGRIRVDGFALDVTASRAIRDELDETRAHLHRIVSAIDAHLYTGSLTAEGGYHEVFTGPKSDILLGPVPPGVDPVAEWDARTHADDRVSVQATYAAWQRGEATELVYRLHGFDGRTRWVRDRAYPRRAPDGTLFVDGIVVDITDETIAAERLQEALAALDRARHDAEERSRTDHLTGIANRAHLSDVLGRELERAEREHTTPGLLLLDLDHFKRVNDRFGHLAGDAVLVEVAARLRHAVRSYDTVARFGGEEFAVLVPAIESRAELGRLGDKLRLGTAQPAVVTAEGAIGVTTSVGGALARPGTSPDALILAADRALYRAKHLGRDRVVVARDDHAGAA